MTLQELLLGAGVTQALIVDDGYDIVPNASDLSQDTDAWTSFFDDLQDDDRVILDQVYPDWKSRQAPELIQSDGFIAALWSARADFVGPEVEALFNRYVRDSELDLAFLRELKDSLAALGVDVHTSGRAASTSGAGAHIIFVDLYLGDSQDDDAMALSIQRLVGLLSARRDSPPLIVLMSRSTRLTDKARLFRDEAALLGAMFRVRSKADLRDPAILHRTVERLVALRSDALVLSAFLRAWERGLGSATSRFLRTIRGLDLADYGQVRQLLLEFEGQPLGSYLLDVYDRVLQHEIEGDPGIVAAAEGLSSVLPSVYPPPHLAGSTDLRDLVFQSTFQHPARLAIRTTTCGAPVSFGDVLITRTALDGVYSPNAGDALVVLTPACDLARSGAKRVLLMAGVIDPLTAATWLYQGNAVRTPAVRLSAAVTVSVRWDLKDIRTVEPTALAASLSAGALSTVCRLREGHALELQQKLLADLGRVGQVAMMPATFGVSVEAGYLNRTGEFVPYDAPSLRSEGAVCFSGRDDAARPIARLIISEAACDELLNAIRRTAPNIVHAGAAAAFGHLLANADAIFSQGFTVPATGKSAALKWQLSAGLLPVGVIFRNPPETIAFSEHRPLGSLVVIVRDL